MADDREVVVKIKSEYDGKGEAKAKEGLKQVATEAEKASEVAQQGSVSASEKALGWAKAIAGVAIAWKAASSAAKWLWESVEMANKNARAVNMLAAAYQNVGLTSAGAIDAAKKFAAEMQNLTGIADEAFLDAQRLLANYGVVGNKAQEAIRAAYALSVSQGMDFESALTQIAKAAAGSTSALSRYGIVLGDGVKEGEKFDAVLNQINDKFGASAQATMGDMSSQVGALKEKWGDLREEIGQNLIPTFNKLIEVANNALNAISRLGGDKGLSVDEMALEKTHKRMEAIRRELKGLYKDQQLLYKDEGLKNQIANLEKEYRQLQRREELFNGFITKSKETAVVQQEQLEAQAAQINAARTLNKASEERAQKEQEVNNKLQEQLETFRQNAQQSSNERKVKFTAELAGADMEGLASIDNRLEQEHAIQQQLAEIRQRALEEQLTRAQSAADAETEIGASKIATAMEQLQEFNAEQIILDEEYTQNREALNERINESNRTVFELQKLLDSQKVREFSKGLNAMAQLQNSKSKELVAIGKAAGIAQATIDTYQGSIAAYQAMAHIPYVGPALGIAAAAALTAYGVERIAAISGIKMAEGGLVKAVTGGVPAVIGEGGSDEAVLPLDDTKAMRRIGGAIAEEGGAMGSFVLTQNITIQAGESLIPDITNALRNATVDALEMANMTVRVGNSQQGYSV